MTRIDAQVSRVSKFVLGLRRLVINYKISTAVISVIWVPLLISAVLTPPQAFDSSISTHQAITPVELLADGHDLNISATGATVADAINQAHIALGPNDSVDPAATTSLNGQPVHVEILRANPVVVTDYSGTIATGFSVHTDGVDILKDLGVKIQNKDLIDTEPSMDFVDSRTVGTHVVIDRAKVVHLTLDGQPQELYSRYSTIGGALSEAGITVGPKDVISEPTSSPLRMENTVALKRFIDKTVTAQEDIAPKMVVKDDASIASGTSVVKDAGTPGKKEVTYRIISLGGQETARDKLSEKVLTPAKDGLTLRGTKPRYVMPSGSAQQLGYQMMLARWGDDQWSCLDQLWAHESGWRVNAANASGAYGIPQSMPGSKMGSAGADWQTDAATQISWGLSYIAGKYGSPCGAWSHWQSARSY